MATKNTDFSKANSHNDELTDPDVLVAHTNWAELEHAHGSAADLPAGLALFLHDNMTVRSEAASTYLEVVNHQNSIYSATTPVALYVASILPDPRTSRAGLFGSGERFPPMRAPLIDWLGGIADDVSDEALEIGRRCGFRTEDPAITRLRAARPALFEAVAAFVHDPDPAVRHAAITAALLLLDSPEQRGRHREEFTPLIHDLLRTSANQYYHLRALDSLEIWGEDADSLRTEHPQTLHPHVPHPWGQTAWKAGPPIFHVFRKVVADRLPSITVSGPAALLFGTRIEQDWDDRRFLSHFYNGILHQDTCWPTTADGVPLLAAIAVDDRVPARHRFDAMDLLFDIATVSDRHQAECWPQEPPHADPVSEDAARTAVHEHVSELLARWNHECPAVRLVLAGLAVVFPTERTLAALTPRLQSFADQYPAASDIGDYVRFVLVQAANDADATLAAVEDLTDAYWRGTARSAPPRGRALHLLQQMLAKVRTCLMP